MSDVVLLSDCRSPGCRDWVRSGRPYSQSKPTAAMQQTGRGHGYTVYGYPDKSHLVASRPEDHTPFSATGWPIPAPRWIGDALDIMPLSDSPADLAELARLARQIIADKDAGVPGTEWIKYLNWTDEDGNCWHVSWESGRKVVTRSTDKGHIHISGRSDWVARVPAAWDPWDRMNHHDVSKEDDDMGATYMNGQVLPAGQLTNVDVGIVAGGAADPRDAWISFTNDGPGDYALRVVWTSGDNNYKPLEFVGGTDDPKTKPVNNGYAGTVFRKGWRAWADVPAGCVALAITRQAVGADGKPAAPTEQLKAADWSLSFAIERGPVKK